MSAVLARHLESIIQVYAAPQLPAAAVQHRPSGGDQPRGRAAGAVAAPPCETTQTDLEDAEHWLEAGGRERPLGREVGEVGAGPRPAQALRAEVGGDRGQ